MARCLHGIACYADPRGGADVMQHDEQPASIDSMRSDRERCPKDVPARCWCGGRPQAADDLQSYRSVRRFRDDRRVKRLPDAGWRDIEPVGSESLSWPADRPN